MYKEGGSEGEVIRWGFRAQAITSTVVSDGVLNPPVSIKYFTYL